MEKNAESNVEQAEAAALTDVKDINRDTDETDKRDTSPGRPGKKKLESLLNKPLKIKMTDGRVLVGIFLCTDRDANVILGSCSEYLKEEDCFTEEPRGLGLVMVPGRHIVSIHKDKY